MFLKFQLSDLTQLRFRKASLLLINRSSSGIWSNNWFWSIFNCWAAPKWKAHNLHEARHATNGKVRPSFFWQHPPPPWTLYAVFYQYFYRTRVRSLAMLVTHSLTDWLTDSFLVNLIDVTLACEDSNSKLVEVVTVADVDKEDHVGNSLLQIWKLMFGPKAKLLFRLWAQGLVKILKLKLRQDFEARVCSAFWRWCFVEVMK